MDTFSFQIALAAGVYDVFEALEWVRSQGLAGVQININGPGGRFLGGDPDNRAHVARVRARMEELGLFAEVGGRSTRAEMLDWQLRLCADLGADVLRTVVDLDDDVERSLRNAVEGLRSVLPLARELGVRIALEDHEDLTADELLRLVRDVDDPSVGVCLDVGNCLALLEDPVETARKLAPHAVACHLKDQKLVRVNGKMWSIGVPLGEGDIDLPAVMQVLFEYSNLDRMLIQDCFGYATPINPFGRSGVPEEAPAGDVPEMTPAELARSGLLLGIEGLAPGELHRHARCKALGLIRDIEFLRDQLAILGVSPATG